MKYYSKKKDAIVFIEQKADDAYWDQHWSIKKSDVLIRNRLVEAVSKKFLAKGSRILEGGCGNGHTVRTLAQAGFDVFGVDYAEKTVRFLNQEFSNLKISKADVRKLPFKDRYFNGYWSLGVIEHFKDGYIDIIREANRVLNDEGYLFLSFPFISLLRRIKIKLKLVPEFDDDYTDFYQFGLNKKSVIRDLEVHGFALKRVYYYDAVKGFKDEIPLLKPIMAMIYNSRKVICRIIRLFFNMIFKYFSSHMCLLVMQKN